MLWSVIKIILFVALIAVITYGAGLVMDTGGSITMQFAGQEVAITPIQVIIALIALVFALWLAQWVFGILVATFKFFNGDETAITRYFGRNKEERGYKALAEGMVALAAGEGKEASDKAATAERLLKRPQLTNLISAQAAEASGDTRRALKYYKRLLQDDQTRFVGVQGLMKQKLTEGDTDTALALAEKAFALRPTHDETMTALFDLQTEKSEWKGAQKTIEAKVRAGKLPKDVGRRREAILGLAVADVERPRASTGQGPREEVPDDNGVSIPPITKSVEQVEGKTIVGVKTYDGHTYILSICDHVTVAVEDFPRNLIGE